jgi:uncharacterized protein YacL
MDKHLPPTRIAEITKEAEAYADGFYSRKTRFPEWDNARLSYLAAATKYALLIEQESELMKVKVDYYENKVAKLQKSYSDTYEDLLDAREKMGKMAQALEIVLMVDGKKSNTEASLFTEGQMKIITDSLNQYKQSI